MTVGCWGRRSRSFWLIWLRSDWRRMIDRRLLDVALREQAFSQLHLASVVRAAGRARWMKFLYVGGFSAGGQILVPWERHGDLVGKTCDRQAGSQTETQRPKKEIETTQRPAAARRNLRMHACRYSRLKRSNQILDCAAIFCSSSNCSCTGIKLGGPASFAARPYVYARGTGAGGEGSPAWH